MGGKQNGRHGKAGDGTPARREKRRRSEYQDRQHVHGESPTTCTDCIISGTGMAP